MKVEFFPFTFFLLPLLLILVQSCMLVEPLSPDRLMVGYDPFSSQVVLQWEDQPFVDRYLIYRGLDINTNTMRLVASIEGNEYRDSYPLSGNLFYSLKVQNFFATGALLTPVMIYVSPSRSLRFPILLPDNTWTNGCIPSSGVLWYELSVATGKNYEIQWRDFSYFDGYVDILVSLYQNTNSYALSGMSDIDYSPISYHSDQTGSLFLKVQTFSLADYGPFEIFYHESTNQ